MRRIFPCCALLLLALPAFAGTQTYRGCRVIRANSNGRAIYAFAANYFSVENRGDQFFFDHVPGTNDEYHLYDAGGQFMASDPSGLVRRQGGRGDDSRWRVENAPDGRRYLRSVAFGRFLQSDFTGLVVRTNHVADGSSASWEQFTLQAGSGCAAPPNNEPSTATTAVTETFSGRTPVRGIADLHVHQFFDSAFGGILAHGESASPNGIEDALRACHFDNGLIVHGVNHASDFVGLTLDQGRRGSGGWPDFGGWPHWGSVDHQQVYYKWLERAWLGGLRLMSVLAVNNELLCGLEPIATGRANRLDCSDMNSVDRQIQAAKDMEEFIDDLAGGPGQGWYRIAYSSQQARQIINNGKLAVVLGIEVSNLFNCNRGTCTQAQVDAAIDRYHALGIRQVMPVHTFNNDFAGAALSSSFYNVGNVLVNGRPFDVWDCAPQGYTFQYSLDPIAAGFANLIGLPVPAGYTGTAHCNLRGLTSGGSLANGEFLLRRLMDKKMIIDVDHMSHLARESALNLTSARALFGGASTGYPVVSSHSQPMASGRNGEVLNESSLTDSQITRIAAARGLIAPNLLPDPASATQQFGTSIPNDCSMSSKVYAQRYLFTLDRLNRAGVTEPAIAFGSDFNGFTAHLAPRFGPDACAPALGEPGAPQANPVAYPFPARGKPGSFSRLVTGSRTFDYNTDGLAHIGLLPDFVRDLENIGLTSAQLDPLFRSAEAYLRLWERAEDLDFTPPAVTPTVSGLLGSGGWYKGDVTVSWNASDPESGISARSGCATTTVSTDTAGVTLTCTAANGAGVSASASVTVKLDKTGPVIACGPADLTWRGTDVSRACTASDGMSGLAAPSDASFSLTTAVPAGVETASAATNSRTVCDVAGNCGTGGPVTGNRVDKKAPVATIVTPAHGAEFLVNQAVTANYTCTDGGSGVVGCSAPLAVGAAIPTATPVDVTFTLNALDLVGLTASVSANYKVTNNICLLYDAAQPRNGAVLPVRVQLCDVNSVPLPAGATLTVLRIKGSAADYPAVQPGNLGAEFRPEGQAYGFNLSIQGLAPGNYALEFRVSGDPVTHLAPFVVR